MLGWRAGEQSLKHHRRRATPDCNACRRFLDDHAPDAAQRAANVIRDHLRQLRDYPMLGRPYAGSENRELPIPFGNTDYLALYRYDASQDTVYVHAFRHQRQAGY